MCQRCRVVTLPLFLQPLPTHFFDLAYIYSPSRGARILGLADGAVIYNQCDVGGVATDYKGCKKDYRTLAGVGFMTTDLYN